MNKKAFTFAEVLIALTVLTVSMYLFAQLQFKSINRARKSTGMVERVFFVKKELYKSFMSHDKKKKTDKPVKQEYEDPQISISTGKQEIQKKSSLKDFSKEIDIISSEAIWGESPEIRRMKMISFAAKQEKREES